MALVLSTNQGIAFQLCEAECGGGGDTGQASIFGTFTFGDRRSLTLKGMDGSFDVCPVLA